MPHHLRNLGLGGSPSRPGSRRSSVPEHLHPARRTATPSWQIATTPSRTSIAGSAISRTQRRGNPLEHSAEPRPRTGRQICGGAPTEPHQWRRRPPQTKATPAPPLPPQRRQLAHHHAHLGYVHTGIRGSPVLPSPRRPPDGEESHGSQAASWRTRFHPKKHCRWGKGQRSKLSLFVF
jgi:hypothetical protein